MDDVAEIVLVLQHAVQGFHAETLAVDLLGRPLAGLERQDNRRGLLRAIADLTPRTLKNIQRRGVEDDGFNDEGRTHGFARGEPAASRPKKS